MSINDRNKKKNVNEGDKKRIKWKIYVNEKNYNQFHNYKI